MRGRENNMAEDGLFKVFKTLAGDGFQTLQTGGGCCCASWPAGPGIFLSVFLFADAVGDGFDGTVPVDVLVVCAL